MMLTVVKNTKNPVKFWFLKNFLSPTITVRWLIFIEIFILFIIVRSCALFFFVASLVENQIHLTGEVVKATSVEC